MDWEPAAPEQWITACLQLTPSLHGPLCQQPSKTWTRSAQETLLPHQDHSIPSPQGFEKQSTAEGILFQFHQSGVVVPKAIWCDT